MCEKWLIPWVAAGAERRERTPSGIMTAKAVPTSSPAPRIDTNCSFS